MKSKKTVYILLVVVAGIWGTLFYKIFSGLGGDNDIKSNTIQIPQTLIANSFSDTFSLIANYRDPFLGKQLAPKIVSDNPPVTVNKTKSQPVVNSSQWPAITYSGMVKNDNSNKTLALLFINGNSQTLKQGDLIENIEVVKIYRDSVLLKQGKEKKFFKKEI